ncbi:MAG: adenylate/guanylate cyclase domain-containing protein [Endomicrobiia bacterium]
MTVLKKTIGWLSWSFFINFLVILLYWFDLFVPVENIFYDLRFKLRGPISPSNNIIIVKIDENSLSYLGRWPWDRKIVAKAVENLFNCGAKIVALDILYPEKSNESSDLALHNALKKGNSVIASHFESFYENVLKDNTIQKVLIEKIIEPIELFNRVCKVGFTNIEPDEDGVVRSVFLTKQFNQKTYYSFNYIIAKEFLGKVSEKLLSNLPSKIFINFYGPSEYFNKKENKIETTFIGYSFIDIYNNLIPPIWIKDKIVLIGATATGSYDHYPTPFIKTYPGVELNATVIENLLFKTYLRKKFDKIHNILFITFTTILLSIFFYNISPVLIVLFIFLYTSGYYLITYYLFIKHFYILEFVPYSASAILAGFSCILHKLIFEQKEKKIIKKTFSKYINPYVMEELLKNPTGSLSGLGGEKKEITVVFTDIRAFTSISEKLPAEEIVTFLNRYFQVMNNIIFKYNGTIDKYIGDCIMCFWNAPLNQPDHAYLAVKCVMEMIYELERLNESETILKGFKIKIGAGINTGEAIVGNIGSIHLMNYTAVGDTVNTASRLQSLTKEFNSPIIISESVNRKLNNRIPTKFLGKILLRGKQQEIGIYKVGDFTYY